MKQRFQARKDIIQGLYQYFMRQESQHELVHDENMDDYVRSCLQGIWETETELNEIIVRYAHDEQVDELYAIDRAILLLGLYELQYRSDVPYKVVIDQGIRLAKCYGGDSSFKLVNAVLDQAAKAARSAEIEMAKPKSEAGD